MSELKKQIADLGEIFSRLHEQRRDLEKQIEHVRLQIHNLRLIEAENLYGVKIGSVVLSGGEELQVCWILPSGHSKPWIRGHPKKTNGDWAKTVRHLYSDWEATTSK